MRPIPLRQHEQAATMCGDEGTRTLNPCLAKAVLCQLSYVPGNGPGAGAPQRTLSVASAQRSASLLPVSLFSTSLATKPATARTAIFFNTATSFVGSSMAL